MVGIASDASLQAAVYTLGGESVVLDLGPDTTVQALKLLVAAHWPIPPLCQRLLLGTTILEDTMNLCVDGVFACDCPEGTSQLTLTLAVYVDGALDILNHTDPKVRQEAVECMTKVASKDYERVTEALCTSCVMDPCFFVRQSAEESLIHVTRVGDKHVIAVLLARLSLPDCSDRRVVLKTLARIGQEDWSDESSSKSSLSGGQLDWDDGLGLAAVEGLSKFASQDPNGGILALCSCLADSLPEVRQAAGQALGRIVREACDGLPHGNDGMALNVDDEGIYLKVQMGIIKRLRRSKGMMKLDALRAFINAAACDDAVAILSVCQCLEEPEPELRQAAVWGLSQISSLGNTVATVAVQGRLGHKSSFVVESAREAYRAITATEEALPRFPEENVPREICSSARSIHTPDAAAAETGCIEPRYGLWVTPLKWCCTPLLRKRREALEVVN